MPLTASRARYCNCAIIISSWLGTNRGWNAVTGDWAEKIVPKPSRTINFIILISCYDFMVTGGGGGKTIGQIDQIFYCG